MANAESRIEHCVNFFSLRGKRKRQFREYKKRVAIFQAMSSEELEFEYIMLKTEYANKKGVLTLFAVTVALTMLVGICNGFLGFMNNVAYYFVNECGYFGEVADNVKMYIDYEALGRDLELSREIYDTGKGIFGIPS